MAELVEGPLISLALITVLGIGASWLAWRFSLPSILLLLIAGFAAGPGLGWLDPDVLLGDLLLPFVSLSVAIILFEGGLSLRVQELREVGQVVRNLVTLGVLVTWVISAAAAHWLIGLDLGLALLLGAILVVTGPTVVLPLLRHLRVRGRLGHVLKWEGILIDPIGVVLAVLVFEALLVGGFQEATEVIVITMSRALLIGVVAGIAGAVLTHQALKRHWVPDALQSPVTLGMVVAVFAACELVQAESGLVGATIMGVVLANQEDIAKRHIVEFKENLRVLLISFLFIVLAARLDRTDLSAISPESLLFLAILILVARPIATLISTVGSSMGWRERAFISTMAPRGIVAAAISSVFALGLSEAGYPGADQLVPLAFLVIIGTVAIYGLAASPLARLLRISDPDPQGVLIVGAQPWARDLAKAIHDAGPSVLMVDTNRRNLQAAWDMGLATHHGSSVTEHMREEVDLDGIGHLLALTPNDEINQLTVLNFLEAFERSHVYQLAASSQAHPGEVPRDLRGRVLFENEATYTRIRECYRAGWRVEAERFEDEPEPGIVPAPEEAEGDKTTPILMVLVRSDGNVLPYTSEQRPDPMAGDTLIRFVPPDA